ncbi:MAG: aldo/keto reductase [Bryobacteraceae bacterium]
MKRRVFVGTAVTGLSANSVSAQLPTGGDIPKRTFGRTGEKLTVIGQAGGRFPLITFEEAAAIVRRAYDLGITYFDNARVYWDGRSEEVYGSVLPPFRKKVFITSKSAGRTRADANADLEKSLRALKTDYLDLWQMHAVSEMSEVDQIFAPGGAIEAFEAAKKAGKARFIGFTGHRDPHVHAEMLRRYDKYDTILMPLHAADPTYLSFEKIVLPTAVERGMGIQGMKNFGNAKLLSMLSARDCLRYVLSLPIHCTAIGCTTIGQLEDDIRIAREFRPFSGEEMAAVRRKVARAAGPTLEDWKRNVQQAASLNTYTGG